MPRWRLVISGKVQIAGYRAMVKNIALGMKVKGLVRNLDDGNVEIYCEAPKEAFENFKKDIAVTNDPKNPLAPSVEEIKTFDEKNPEYGTAPFREFKAFKIDYGDVDLQVETLERSEMGIIALGAVNTNIKAMSGKLDNIENATIKTHEKLDKIADGTIKTHEMLHNIDNRLGGALTRYDTIGQKMASMESNMEQLTKQITRFVDHMVGEEKKPGARKTAK